MKRKSTLKTNIKKKKALFKEPGNVPKYIQVRPTLKDISDKVGGAFYRLTIQLSTGLKIDLYYYQLADLKRDYHFTIMPTPDKRTWIDICGPVLIFTDGDRELTEKETAELFAVPYEES